MYDLLLSELAKNMALSVNELDLINFREPKFVYLHIKLTENENFVCVEGINLVCCVHGIEQSNLLVKLQNLVLSVMKQLPTFL